MPGATSGDAPMLQTRLQVEHVHYSYPRRGADDQWPAGLCDISFNLAAGQSLGIIGATGAGKTTLVDVILGLLVHDGGAILVDGVAITDANRAAWQRRIGYVPQDIFLSASSVAENIAFGLDWAAIDHGRVAEVARMAHIDDFIVTQLPQAYATQVGERGITLSGGQRTRAALGALILAEPDFILLDEPTNNLDRDGRASLIELLATWRSGAIVVSHDRELLETMDAIVEMTSLGLTRYGGNWSHYRERKALELLKYLLSRRE